MVGSGNQPSQAETPVHMAASAATPTTEEPTADLIRAEERARIRKEMEDKASAEREAKAKQLQEAKDAHEVLQQLPQTKANAWLKGCATGMQKCNILTTCLQHATAVPAPVMNDYLPKFRHHQAALIDVRTRTENCSEN